MISFCMCLTKGFSFEKSQRNSFLKKPLVAISLLVIIAMCLTVAEAAPRAVEHRRRHHRRAESMALRTKDPTTNEVKISKNQQFKAAQEDVILRLKNNLRNYKEQLKIYKRTNSLKSIHGNPPWLPKIDLVQIHFHESKNLRSRFSYVMPKFYKHVRQYRAMFDVLLNNMNISYSANLYSQLKKRDNFLNSTLNNIDLLITDVTDAMRRVNFSIPELDDVKMNIEALHRNVDSTEYDFQDQIAFRAYENLVRSWRLELRCWKRGSGAQTQKKMCLDYKESMKRKNCSRPRAKRPVNCMDFKWKH